MPGLGYLFVLCLGRPQVRRNVGHLLILIPPLIGAALLATDSLHHLIRPTAYLNTAPLFPELFYPITTVQGALLGYILVFFLVNPMILLAFTVRTKGILRRQALLVAIALLIPLAGSMLTIFGVRIGPYRDTTPVTFALQDLVILVALAGFDLFNLVPLARDLAIDQMDVSLLVENLRHRVVDANRAACEAIGLPMQQIIGSSIEEVFPYHRDLLERHQNTMDAVLEVEGRRPNTIGRSYEVHLSSARDHRGRRIGRLLLMQDITVHKKLEEDLRKTRDELASRLADLQRAQEELLRRERLSTLGQTVATVSHELRNPLATVRNALFSIRQDLAGADQPRTGRALELAERNIRRCDAIIVELLDYSRPRAPVLEEIEVDAWLDPGVGRAGNTAGHRGATEPGEPGLGPDGPRAPAAGGGERPLERGAGHDGAGQGGRNPVGGEHPARRLDRAGLPGQRGRDERRGAGQGGRALVQHEALRSRTGVVDREEGDGGARRLGSNHKLRGAGHRRDTPPAGPCAGEHRVSRRISRGR